LRGTRASFPSLSSSAGTCSAAAHLATAGIALPSVDERRIQHPPTRLPPTSSPPAPLLRRSGLRLPGCQISRFVAHTPPTGKASDSLAAAGPALPPVQNTSAGSTPASLNLVLRPAYLWPTVPSKALFEKDPFTDPASARAAAAGQIC
jgi:hypothetical protein